MNIKKVNPLFNKNKEIFNVIIEISQNSNQIKYEIDKNSGYLTVDRIINIPMRYPCNYGFIPQTLAQDGDPIDAIVISPYPIMVNSIISCKPIGIMNMEDEKGIDHKILMKPSSNITSIYDKYCSYKDLPHDTINQIEYFFTHYKDCENNKWTKILGWNSYSDAIDIINHCIKKYKKKNLLNK